LTLDKIANHYLVPKHEIVPEDRIEEILKKYGTNVSNLPRVLRDDPAIVEIGAKKGDVVKITRSSQTAGQAIYFRLVF
jgi:DNA-directed RNA polymerase subunit H